MKKFSFKKVGIPIILAAIIVLSSVITIWTMKQTDTVKREDESTLDYGASVVDGSFHYEESTKATEEGVTEVSVETTILENGEVETHLVNVPVGVADKETEKAGDSATSHGYTKPETRPVQIYTTKPNGGNNNSVATTKKQETTTKKAVTTTKPVETTKKPTTTKAPKDEYYPALTQADIEEIKQYTINYIKSKGQPVRSTLDWDNAGFSSIFTVPVDMSKSNFFKRDGGVDPVEWAKGQMKDSVDYHIWDFESVNGPGSIAGLYPLVKLENGYWNFTLGYC